MVRDLGGIHVIIPVVERYLNGQVLLGNMSEFIQVKSVSVFFSFHWFDIL